MRSCRQNSIYHISFKICLVFYFFVSPVWAEMGNSLSMDTYYEETGADLTVWAKGNSFIKDGCLEKKSRIRLENFNEISKVVLVWSGEVRSKGADFKRIALKCPSKVSRSVEADRVYEVPSAGIVYSCFADITSIYEGPGNYEIGNLVSHAITKEKEKAVYSVGGYAVVVVYKDKKIKKKRKVRINSGILLLAPSEMHNLNILKKKSGLVPVQISVVGGHGRKGNASANLINGISISGGEDWDGSSGEFWDVDTFEVEMSNIKDTGAVLTFDSLLQWIYPVAVISVFEGEKK